LAKEYVELVSDGEPNGLGQYVHPQWGVSHSMMYLMQTQYGAAEANNAINEAFRVYTEERKAR